MSKCILGTWRLIKQGALSIHEQVQGTGYPTAVYIGGSVVAVGTLITLKRLLGGSNPEPLRYIPNPYPKPSNDAYALSSTERTSLEAGVEALVREILEKTEAKDDDVNFFVYTGSSGIAYMLYRYYQYSKDPSHLEQASRYIHRALEQMVVCERDYHTSPQLLPGSLIGYSGVYAVATLIAHAQGNGRDVDEMLSRLNTTVLNATWTSNELLFGRAGVLVSCLEVNDTLGRPAVPQAVIAELVKGIDEASLDYQVKGIRQYPWPIDVSMGESCQSMTCLVQVLSGPRGVFGRIPTWMTRAFVSLFVRFISKAVFLGAGHGVIGVEQAVLLSSVLDKNSQARIVTTLRTLNQHRSPQGNYPMLGEWLNKNGKHSDLVHWCHGVCGTGMTLALAVQRLGQPQHPDLKEAAVESADVTWERGLLKKGNGLCHGVAGNGYLFLTLYRLTLQRRYWEQAVRFAEFALSKDPAQKTPDNPYSLFEGNAGLVCYILDVLQPDRAAFPFYQVAGLQ